MQLTVEQQKTIAFCACSCCAEAFNLIHNDRDPRSGCSCADYGLDEVCDCLFCEMVRK